MKEMTKDKMQELLDNLHATICALPYSGSVTLLHPKRDDHQRSIEIDIDNLKRISKIINEYAEINRKNESILRQMEQTVRGLKQIFAMVQP